MLSDREAAIARVCFDAEPSETDLESLGAPDRWLLYRKMVRHRLKKVASTALPRTKRALGEDRFEIMVAAWFAGGGPRARYFRNVPIDFCQFALPRWKAEESPWIAELAELEIAIWSVKYASSQHPPASDFSFDKPPLLTPALEILRFAHPVHRTPTPSEGYAPEQTLLCIYRDPEHQPVTWILNALAADLIETWVAGDRTVAETVQMVAAAHNTEISPAFIDKLSTLIADFLERGVLLGGHAPPS